MSKHITEIIPPELFEKIEWARDAMFTGTFYKTVICKLEESEAQVNALSAALEEIVKGDSPPWDDDMTTGRMGDIARKALGQWQWVRIESDGTIQN